MVDGKRTGEGEQPQAPAVAGEESYSGVVLEKPAKTRVTPVERVEERAEAKRESAGERACPTQGGVEQAQDCFDVTDLEQRIGRKAQESPTERFTNLLSHLKVPLLREAYQRLRKNAAAGVDQVTWGQYGERLDERLRDLQDRIHRGGYHPRPVRRVRIPKGDGRERLLGIPALEDKLVQQAVRVLLEPIYESMFMGFSYGYRPGRSQHHALDALATVIVQRKVNWVLDADIRSFFDTIDHGWMQQFIEHRIGDRRLVRLLMKWMRAGVMEEGELHEVEEGTPQGAIISPLLANIYLHYVLDLWVHQWRERQGHGEVYIVRYADDFVMGFQFEKDARAMREELSSRLGRFGLELHPDKSRVLEFGRFAAERRARRGLRRPETFTFLGFTHIAGKNQKGKFLLKRRTSRRKRQAKLAQLRKEVRARRHQPVSDQHRWLSQVLEGHYRYYAVPTNIRALASIHHQVESTWHKWLQRRSQKAPWTRRQRELHKARFPLPKPRILHPWPTDRFASR